MSARCVACGHVPHPDTCRVRLPWWRRLLTGEQVGESKLRVLRGRRRPEPPGVVRLAVPNEARAGGPLRVLEGGGCPDIAKPAPPLSAADRLALDQLGHDLVDRVLFGEEEETT